MVAAASGGCSRCRRARELARQGANRALPYAAARTCCRTRSRGADMPTGCGCLKKRPLEGRRFSRFGYAADAVSSCEVRVRLTDSGPELAGGPQPSRCIESAWRVLWFQSEHLLRRLDELYC